MPQIKIEKVVSFSSEDAAHPASNILISDPGKKWKCQNVGEKSSTVVLQLEKACNINKIDIGNEHSAYIEVLVSRSSSPEDFKVLLVMSSFMSPSEARQSENINKVRMFTKNDLSDPERNEKWDRIKIVCTQPFNKHVQYGLSFINFYTSEDLNSDKQQSQKTSDLLSFGKFQVRPASPDLFVSGTLFSKRKELSQDSPTLKGAAAIREVQSVSQMNSPLAKKIKQTLGTPGKNRTSLDTSKEIDSPKPRNRNEILYNDDEESKNEKIDKHIEKKSKEKEEEKLRREKDEKIRKEREAKAKKEKEEERRRRDNEKEDERRKKEKDESKVENKKKDKPNDTPNKNRDKTKEQQRKQLDISVTPKTPNKRKNENNSFSNESSSKSKKAKLTKPFEKLLENVVLVISGIQNPERASLRSMALSMGAKYKPDWDNRCTHLICAFANTPKFNQVKGKGKIVKKNWIDDCYNERKRLPWRRYALDKSDQGSPESEEEIWEKGDTPPSTSPVPSTSAQRKVSSGPDADNDSHLRDEGSDTEELVRKIQEKQKFKKQSKEERKMKTKDFSRRDEGSDIEEKPKTKQLSDEERKMKTNDKADSPSKKDDDSGSDVEMTESKTDVYSVDTDSEGEKNDKSLTKELRFIENNLLEDFFADKLFYIDDVFDKDLRRKLRQYVVAYKGLIVDELDTSVEIMVTTKNNSSLLRDLFPSTTCVAPDWIWECHNCRKLVSMDKYVF